MKSIFVKLFLTALAVVIISQACAHIPGSISGGAKDTIPPVFISAVPENYNIWFKGKKIEITFDEFLRLSDINNQFFSSVPMQKQPEVLLYGKMIRVKLKEPLKDSMTYVFNFGQGITDNNEGNKLESFLYIFSTYDVIDSLTLTGRILNAENLNYGNGESKTANWIILHSNMDDSAFLKEAPVYVTKADRFGYFTFENLKAGQYKVFGITDMGNNYYYDQPKEAIAFLDTVINIDTAYYRGADTLFKCSNNVVDSIKEFEPNLLNIDLQLYQFTEAATRQYRSVYERPEANILRFIYTLPVDSVSLQVVDSMEFTDWYYEEISLNRDTLVYYLKDTALINRKNIVVALNSPRTDSVNNLVYQVDTLKMSYEDPNKKKNSRKTQNPEEEKPKLPHEKMEMKPNVSSTMDLKARYTITCGQPIGDLDETKIILKEEQDTSFADIKRTVVRDSVNSRMVYVDFTLKPDNKYQLLVDSMAFRSIYGVDNDSTMFQFKTQKEEYYGRFVITFDTIPERLIVQVLKASGKEELVVKEKINTDSLQLVFDYLPPGKYKLKAIYDENANGKWDPGKYIEKRQPEAVEYYPQSEVEIPEGWDVELQWSLLRMPGKKERIIGNGEWDKKKEWEKKLEEELKAEQGGKNKRQGNAPHIHQH